MWLDAMRISGRRHLERPYASMWTITTASARTEHSSCARLSSRHRSFRSARHTRARSAAATGLEGSSMSTRGRHEANAAFVNPTRRQETRESAASLTRCSRRLSRGLSLASGRGGRSSHARRPPARARDLRLLRYGEAS